MIEKEFDNKKAVTQWISTTIFNGVGIVLIH